MEGGPATFVPSRLTHDQIREINAKVHVMNELIDEACGRVLQTIAQRGWLADTDVIFTTDHGEMQGDFGLLYKGPYHTDALMRLPFVWRPAPSAGVAPAVVHDPVGQVDLAPTFCAIAGVDPAPFMQGRALPHADGEPGRERALCEWDSQFPGYGMHLRTVYRDGWLCTVYEPSTAGQPNGLEEVWGDAVLSPAPSSTSSRPPARAAWPSPPGSSTTWTPTPTSSTTAGTTRPSGPSATSWWPTSTPACPPSVRALKVMAPA